MAFDGITVANLRRDLDRAMTGGRINRIIQPEPDALLLTFKGPVGQGRLYISASASLPLRYLTEENRTAPATAPGFCMLLRKHIGSARILGVSQPSLERILFIDLEHYDEMGDLCRKRLIVELMGKHSNIIFCDDKDMILDSIKHISSQVSSVREVLPGRSYFIPMVQDKLNPLDTDPETFVRALTSKPMPLSKALYSSYTGISPLIAEELLSRAGIDPGQNDEKAARSLWKPFEALMKQVQEEDFSPVVVMDDKERPVDFAAVRLTMYRDLQIKEGESISAVLRSFYAMKDAYVRMRQKNADLRHIVSTAVERTSKKLDLQLRQMQDTKKMDKYKLYGEMLHTYGYDAKPGDKSLTVLNYYTNEPLTIPLDPTLTASENAKKYFDRFAKLKRTAAALTEQIAITQADLDQLLSIQTFLDMPLTEADLAQVRAELVEAGYIKNRFSREKGKGKGTGAGKGTGNGKGSGKGAGKGKMRFAAGPYHYRTKDGFDIYVGKNNLQNDQLTFKEAQGGDWWFHAKGAPGSHVILKVKGDDVPDHAFEDAARLAAYYSANREAGRVEIDYVQRKHVKKPSGARPGFVVYYTNYSMVIDTDISGLTLVE